MYWSIANLAHFQNGLSGCTDLILFWTRGNWGPFMLMFIRKSNAGLYFVWLNKQPPADEEVLLDELWRLKTWALQYRVAISTCAKSRGKAFSLDGHHQGKLSIQNVHCPALKTFNATWWVAMLSKDLCTYLEPFREGIFTPEFHYLCYSYSYSPSQWQNSRYWAKTSISKHTLIQYLNDAKIREKIGWKWNRANDL